MDYYNSSTYNKFKTFSGKELHDDFGFNLLSYKFRFHDPALGRFISIDPLSEERMWVSPYNYAQNNPINRIDPDGALDVRPNEKVLEAIQKGLSASDAKYVKLDSKGFIDKKLINSASSESGNFNALKQLVNDTKVYDVKVTDKLTYKDENGATKTQKMEVSYTDFITGEKLPQVEGAQGYTAVPGTKDPVNSPDSEVKIVVSSGLNALDQSKNIAHEAYGHGYLYSRGEDEKHRGKGMVETNMKLRNQIKSRVNETETNFKKGNK